MATDQGSWERITAALESAVGAGRSSGEWTRYCCPAHEADGRGHKPSLGIKYDLAQQKTVVKCFTGCDNETILDSLGLQVRDIYDRPITRGTYRGRRRQVTPPTRTVSRADRAIEAAGLPLTKPGKDLGRKTGRGETVAQYVYMWPDGQVEGEVVRKHIPHEHGREKEFFQRRWNRESGRMEPGGFSPLPFQLPEVLDAVAEGRTIYIAEGEEDVKALHRAGVAATCNAAGAGKWRAEHAQWLRGARRVVVIADRDAAGYRHADKVAQSLDGLVGEVRVVQAAAGKDTRDHFAAGHELGEMEPVPGLDHRTPIAPAAQKAGGVPFAGEAALDSAGTVASPTHPPRTSELNEGALMGEISGLGMNDHVQHHDDAMDHIGSRFGALTREFMNALMLRAQQALEKQRLDLERAQAASEERRKAYEEMFKSSQQAFEKRLGKLRERGWDKASRRDLADAVLNSSVWAEHSEDARRALVELSSHIHGRYGVLIDPVTGRCTVDASPDLLTRLALAEQDRAAGHRLQTAQDRMVSLIAAEDSVPESRKQELYAQIDEWRRNPGSQQLDHLTQQLKAAGVADKTRTEVRFVATYLGTPDRDVVPDEHLGAYGAASPSNELRKLPEPLVDPGEEVKARIDTLLLDYQTRLRLGLDTDAVQARLAEAVEVLTPEDKTTARQRGVAIRLDPSVTQEPLWPNHIDRTQMEAEVRVYAATAGQLAVDSAMEKEDPVFLAQTRQRVAKTRNHIESVITKGEGIHPLEKDQLRAVLDEIDAGKMTIPELMWADDRSAAAVDMTRSDDIARATAEYEQHQLEQILSTAAAPAHTTAKVKHEIAAVRDGQTQLAAGRMSLRDYEARQLDERLAAALAAAGVPEPVRNQARHQIDDARHECAVTGKAAQQIQSRWHARREVVATARQPEKPAYDGAQRYADLENDLLAAGLDKDQVAQRLAAASGRARPISAAVQPGPAAARPPRTTAPGSGMRLQRGRQERGKGL